MTPLLLGLAAGLGVLGMFLVLRIRGAIFGAPFRQGQGPDCSVFTLTTIDGSPFPLAEQVGKVLLVVNTASRCGFTKQYAGLEALWQQFRSPGLMVVAVPTNDFLRQEPGSDADIANFCQLQHGTTFPLMRKLTTRGPEAHPLYRAMCSSPELGGAVRWNFEKCLIDRQGRLRARIAPRVPPDDPRLITLITALLNEEPLSVAH